MIQLVTDYQHYLDNLKEYIDKSPYKTSFFIKQLRLSKPTFYRKLREKGFTVTEVDIMTKLLFPKEALEMRLAKSEEDIKAGRVYSHAEAMKKLRQQYTA